MANYAEALSKRAPKPGPKKLRAIEIESASNGGHTVTHRFHSGDGPYHDPEKHVFGKGEGKKMMSHIAEHMKVQMVADKDEDGE